MNDDPNSLKYVIRGVILFLLLMWLASACTPSDKPDPINYIDDQYYGAGG